MRTIDARMRGRILQLSGDPWRSLDAIAQLVGCSRPTVRRVLTQAGVTRRPRARAAATVAHAPDTATIIARYQAGESMATIASALHHHWQTVRRVLVAAGIPIRAKGGPTPGRHTGSRDHETAQQARVHARPCVVAHSDRPTDALFATVQSDGSMATAPAPSPCPGCCTTPCPTPLCCGRRLRTLAQHRGRKEARRAA